MDLRAEVKKSSGREDRDRIDALTRDWRSAGLSSLDAALCAFAEKLTHSPEAVVEADINALRAEGLDDLAIHDAIQVTSYFNYINRVAHAVHVELEPEMPPYPEGG